MTTPNEELRARRIADAEAAMQACYMDHADNRLTTTLLHDMATAAVAALARQEEGREAVATVDHSEYVAAQKEWRQTFWTKEPIPFRTKLYTHPTPPIAAIAPHSGGEGDAMRTLLQEVLDECAGMECFPCEGSMAPFEDLCGRIARTLATPTPQAGEVETCEGGAPDCGPVARYDSEGVPLCQRCWDGLVADEAAEQPSPASPQGASDAIELLRHRLCNDEDAWRALLVVMNALNYGTAAGAAPEGFVLVPRIPTREMWAAANSGNCWEDAYAKMLAAAQQPGAQHGQEGRDG